MPVVLTHLPHLALALAALGLAARVEVGPWAHRPRPSAWSWPGSWSSPPSWSRCPSCRAGIHRARWSRCTSRPGGLGALRAGWVTPRRLGLPGVPGVMVGVAIGLVVGLGYLVAGLVMTHGTLLAGG